MTAIAEAAEALYRRSLGSRDFREHAAAIEEGRSTPEQYAALANALLGEVIYHAYDDSMGLAAAYEAGLRELEQTLGAWRVTYSRKGYSGRFRMYFASSEEAATRAQEHAQDDAASVEIQEPTITPASES
jgi:hypothetical protein